MQAYVSLDFEDTFFKGEDLPIFFSGCDFNCPYCYVPKLLKFSDESLIDIKTVKKFIEDSSSAKKNVVFTGGEPGLQRQALLSLARFAKKGGLRTVLDTNGSKPDALKSLLMSELIDEIRLDIKSDIASFEKVTKSKTFFIDTQEIYDEVKRSIKILKEYQKNIDIIIITTIVPSLVFKKQQLDEIVELIKELKCTYQLRMFDSRKEHVNQNFKDISTPTKNFINSLVEYLEKTYPHLLINNGM